MGAGHVAVGQGRHHVAELVNGPVRKILVVRSGPEGPQFPRSVGTLSGAITNTDCMAADCISWEFFPTSRLFHPEHIL